MKTLKKIVCLTALGSMMACGNPKTINGKHYPTCGLINSLADDCKDPKIAYRVNIGNVLLGTFFLPSVIIPVYFFGFSILDPIDTK